MQIEGTYCSAHETALSSLVRSVLFGASIEGYGIGLFVVRPRLQKRILPEGYYIVLFAIAVLL